MICFPPGTEATPVCAGGGIVVYRAPHLYLIHFPNPYKMLCGGSVDATEEGSAEYRGKFSFLYYSAREIRNTKVVWEQ